MTVKCVVTRTALCGTMLDSYSMDFGSLNITSVRPHASSVSSHCSFSSKIGRLVLMIVLYVITSLVQIDIYGSYRFVFGLVFVVRGESPACRLISTASMLE